MYQVLRTLSGLVGVLFVVLQGVAADKPQELVVTGERVTSEDIKNADASKTFSPAEFNAFIEQHTKEQCKRGVVRSRTDGTIFWIEQTSYSFEELGHELINRYKEHPFYCVDIRGPGYDIKRVNKLLRAVKDVTEIESITWGPDSSK